jgi:polysaccharide export outer membrane protein
MPLKQYLQRKFVIQRFHGRLGAFLIFNAFLFVGFFSGCVANQPQQDLNYSYKDDEINQINEQILASAQMHSDAGDYLLGAGDLLQIGVFEAKELDAKVRVSSRGYITLPLIGSVLVKGLSAREAEQKIEELYRERYIKNPHVGIFIEEHFSRRVTLMGQFKNPGTYDYISKQRLLDVMALGGGLSDKAGLVVQIRKSSGSPDGQGVFFVDLDQLIKEGQSELNIKINAGDVLFVPEAGVFFVDGAVRNPGSYYIKHQTTVQEAFVEAGGLAPYANKNQAVLVRYTKKGDRQVIKLDLSQPNTLEIAVKDRDVLIAESSAFGQLVHGMGVFVGFPGLGGLGYRNPAR